ncbi:MAG TPA: hypothetical protein VF609_15055, partial [Flavisolibacter sp.]
MIRFLKTILDWSEAWSPLIPLLAVLKYQKQPNYLRPIVFYVVFASIFNAFGNIIADYGAKWNFPVWMQRNVFLYNIHSIIRFILFTSFFNLLRQSMFSTLKRALPVISIPLIFAYFFFFEDFNNPEHISGYFLAAEAFVLLLYCVQYYIN